MFKSNCLNENDFISTNFKSSEKNSTLIGLHGARHKSRNILIHTLKNCFHINYIDFMVTDNIYSNEIIVRPFIDIAIENSSPSSSFNVLELCSYSPSGVSKSVKYVIDSCYPQLVINYKLIATNEKLKHEDNLGIETVDWTSFENDSSIRYSNLITYEAIQIVSFDSILQLSISIIELPAEIEVI